MSKVQALRQTPPPRASEREDLAAAIEYYNNAVSNLARINEAIVRLRTDVIAPAEKRADSAKRTIAELKPTAPGRLAAAFLGEIETVASIAQMRAECDEASEALQAAYDTRVGLQERKQEAERALDAATHRRDGALSAVVRSSPELTALIARYESTRREVARLASMLESVGIIHMPKDYRWDVLHYYRDLHDDDRKAWPAALDALKSNADAALPD